MVSRFTLEELDNDTPSRNITEQENIDIEKRADEYISSNCDVLLSKYDSENLKSIEAYKTFFRKYLNNTNLLSDDRRPMSITSIKAGLLFKGIPLKDHSHLDVSNGISILDIELIDHLTQLPIERIIERSEFIDDFKTKFDHIRDGAINIDNSICHTDGRNWGVSVPTK
jgi:hypothetical protein